MNLSNFLQAFKRGLHYPGRLIIFMGWYQGRWWEKQVDAENLTCTPQERSSILEHALTVHHFNFAFADDMETTSGIVCESGDN